LPSTDPLPRFSNGIALRRLLPTDLAAFQAYRRDPELARYQGWSPTSDDEARAFLAEMSTVSLLRPGEWSQIGIAERETLDLVGDIGLFPAPDREHVEIGFTLSRLAQGRGMATAAVREAIRLAFELTDAAQVRGVTDARNASSIRLMERVDMVKAESRSAVFRGERCIEYIYSVARRRYGERRG
jgi:aminoglycoside 6'-N-acetyltransferase